MPFRCRNMVVLPAPLAPSTAVRVPRRIVREQSVEGARAVGITIGNILKFQDGIAHGSITARAIIKPPAAAAMEMTP